MPSYIQTYIICPWCGGDGKVPEGGGAGDCPHCEQTGKIPYGYLDVESISLAENTFHSYIVLEEIDTTEYNALTDSQKDGVKALLSCGIVDLNDGKAGRVRLWNWFGAESTTVANLTALLA